MRTSKWGRNAGEARYLPTPLHRWKGVWGCGKGDGDGMRVGDEGKGVWDGDGGREMREKGMGKEG